MRIMRPAPRLVCLLACLLVAGCSGGPDDQPELGTVHGKVTLDGKPLSEASVTFQPENGRPSTAVTDAEGNYELTYINQQGAAVGKHTVRISKSEVKRDGQGEIISAKERLPAQYNKHSSLTKQVNAGKNSIDLPLKSQG